jgi:hypothetical protein
MLAHTSYFLNLEKMDGTSKNESLATKPLNGFHLRDGRTTQLTPNAVKAVPERVAQVMGSSNSSQAIMAVVGGTKYIRLVTEAAAPRWINM